MRDLYIQNYPSHGINVAGVLNSTIQNIILNNSLGDAPNNISNGLAAAHNTDGFDLEIQLTFYWTTAKSGIRMTT